MNAFCLRRSWWMVFVQEVRKMRMDAGAEIHLARYLCLTLILLTKILVLILTSMTCKTN